MRTNFNHTPWYIVNADDMDMTYIALITQLFSQLNYHKKDEKIVLLNLD